MCLSVLARSSQGFGAFLGTDMAPARLRIVPRRAAVANAFIRVNPLEIQMTYVRVDQAFEEPRHD